MEIISKIYLSSYADFDGDCLSVKLLLNDKFDKACENVYSPRNAFCISRDDGLFNSMVCIFKDTVINTEAFIHMTRNRYSAEQLNRIKYLQSKYADAV